MKLLLMKLNVLIPQLMEVASQNDGANTKKLIMMGGMFVTFVVIFILASKKMRKKK